MQGQLHWSSYHRYFQIHNMFFSITNNNISRNRAIYFTPSLNILVFVCFWLKNQIFVFPSLSSTTYLMSCDVQMTFAKFLRVSSPSPAHCPLLSLPNPRNLPSFVQILGNLLPTTAGVICTSSIFCVSDGCPTRRFKFYSLSRLSRPVQGSEDWTAVYVRARFPREFTLHCLHGIFRLHNSLSTRHEALDKRVE